MNLYEDVEVIDLERDSSEDPKDGLCSICLEVVLDPAKRSIAKLSCGHEFHLDCIGSAFNSKGAMQCPNCRKVEKGQWLYANGHQSSTDNIDDWAIGGIYALSFPELPFPLNWCPVRGLTPLSPFDEGEPRSNTRSINSIPLVSASFHPHPTSLEGQLSGDMIHSQSFSAMEQHGRNWQQQQQQQQSSLSFLSAGTPDWPAAQPSSRLPRNEPSSHQRPGTFAHPHTFLHGPVLSLGQSYNGEVRSHGHGHPSHRASTRPRPRGFAASSSSADARRVNGFPLSGSSSRGHQDGEGVGRSLDRLYGFGREGRPAPLPWIANDGEPQWWAPFDPSQDHMMGNTDSMAGNLFPMGSQSHPENGYHHSMPPPYM